ncbi:hypothetical protein [Chroococcidiopsis sp.]|uniref:hypothetical protein n=1 Tax=Chroococcidiopsis sp. TaxID=3088168 RepID=UPI003F3FCAB8
MTYVTEATVDEIPTLISFLAVGGIQTYRYFVQLITVAQTIDDDFYQVPVDHKVLDVVVVEQGAKAIEELLEEKGYLKGWKIVCFWQPEECDCF